MPGPASAGDTEPTEAASQPVGDAVPCDLELLTSRARAAWSPASRWTAGEVTWSVLTAPRPLEAAAFGDAVAWRQGGFVVVLGTGRRGLAEAIDWADGADLEVCEGDETLAGAARVAGYAEAPDAPFSTAVHRSLRRDAPRPRVPGYLLRGATIDDELVEVHRRSWLPSSLPFAEGHQPSLEPDAQSGFDAGMLARIQDSPLYRRDLHLVAEDSAGTLVASCIVWLDEPTGAASIEPLGVDPGHRRRGLGRALSELAAHDSARAGAAELVVHPRGDAAYPAALATYLAAGFAPSGRTRTMTPRRRVH